MIREIAASLGVNVDEKGLKNFMGMLDDAKGAMGMLGKALAGGAVALFAKHTIEAADAIGDLAGKLGVSTDDLQAFEYAMIRGTGSAEGYDKAIHFLTKNIGAAAEGAGPAADAFRSMGISVKDANGNVTNAMDALPQIAEHIKGLGSHAEKTALATKIFGKAAIHIVPLLDQGAAGISQLRQEFEDLGGGMDKNFIAQSAEAINEQKKFKLAMTSLSSTLMSVFMPAINAIAKHLVKWIGIAVKMAKQTHIMEIAAGAFAVMMTAKFLPMILQMVKAVSALRTTVLGASLPFLLVAAAVLFLVLIFEDLWNLVQGNDSLIGKLMDKYGEAGDKAKLIETLKTAWTNIKTAMEPVIELVKDLWKRIMEGSDKWIPALANAFVAVVKTIVAGITAFGGLIAAAKKAKDLDFKGAIGEIDKAGDSIFGKSNAYSVQDENGNYSMERRNVGGLFGMSQEKFNAEAAERNAPRGPVQQTNQIKTEVKVINAAGMTAEQAASATNAGVQSSTSDALAALTPVR